MLNMNGKQWFRRRGGAGCILFTLLLPSCGPQPSKPEPTHTAETAEKKEYPFIGTIEKVDSSAGTISVKNQDIPGWMNSMTMTYSVDTPDILKSLKPGDQIKAKVYDGDYKILHAVQAAPSQ
jgi:Cu/Ag efflux protein CusF